MRKLFLMLAVMMLAAGINGAYAQFEDFEDGGQQSTDRQRQASRAGGNDRLIDRLRFGGDFGIGFSSCGFACSIDPTVGYSFNRYVTAGVIATCEYYKYSETSYRASYSKSNFGGGLFAEAYPIDFLVAHAEFQVINYDDYYSGYQKERRTDTPMLLGLGYHRNITERAGFNIMFLWNFNDTEGLRYNTSFSNPIIRFSVIF